jgi:hypothetical protein
VTGEYKRMQRMQKTQKKNGAICGRRR